MVEEGPVKMAPANIANRTFEDVERDLEALLGEQQHYSRAGFDQERELNIYRSGSAPPTVEGSRTAISCLLRSAGPADAQGAAELSEDEMRSHPAYLNYYYSENLNPRFPPPMVSREDWRATQRFHVGSSLLGDVGDRGRRKESWEGDRRNGSSLFSSQPGLPMRVREQEFSDQNGGVQRNLPPNTLNRWLEHGAEGLIGLADIGLGPRRKSFADGIQEELGHSSSIPGQLIRPLSRNIYDNFVDPSGASDSQFIQLHNGPESVDGQQSGAVSPNLVRVKSLGSSISHSFATALNTHSRSTTPDLQVDRRSPIPCLPPLGGRLSDVDKKVTTISNGLGGVSSCVADCNDMTAALSGLNLSTNVFSNGENLVSHQLHQKFTDQSNLLPNLPGNQNKYLQHKTMSSDLSKLTSNGPINFQEQSSSTDLYKTASSVGATGLSGISYYEAAEMQNIQGIRTMLNNQLDEGAAQYVDGAANNVGSSFQVIDPRYAQYIQRASVAQAASGLDPSSGGNYLGSSLGDIFGFQKGYIETLCAQQRLQYGVPLSKRPGGLNNGLYGNPTFGPGIPYPPSPTHLTQSEQLSHFPSVMRSGRGGSIGSWNPENTFIEESFVSSLLDEFKNNKSRSFELSDILSHVVEFSKDQYGSRFIQQKLETASFEETNRIFPEIIPHARSLMTDVFGNYVIQKFFQHGTEIQRKQLASQLKGHVLPLSLQMYGCRVIQKALEVVDIEEQTEMVSELDGSIIKCVRDQNGNHVVQKCIECVPQERIQFIISAFYGQVVVLSSHPYGCRVIQRVLEHCDDGKTQSIMMEEILQSVCTLAQDQYGNYVIQHILQHRKPEERSAIISKLSGQIVRMSQQKFASNVVEKCLTYGRSEERQLLINEMLGSNDENEPLQAMMKDQFGNYVVQKVLETCDDHNRELILSRIRVHLNALKKYTYGKHIVARVEKLITTGERRIGVLSYSS